VKRLMLACLLLVGPWGLAAQQPGDVPAARPRALRQGPALRRQMLQQRVVARFMDRVSQRLALDAGQRQRLEQVLRSNEVERRALTREARDVRVQLERAASDPSTPDRQYDELLTRMGDLRARDLDLWRHEQAQLATVLTARQRAQFMAMRLEFLEMVQRARARAARQPPAETASAQP
jgi:hypothetical protein